jgi:hypothetical protein
MRAFEFLNESIIVEARGLFARAAGEKYQDSTGAEYVFTSMEKFPEQGKYKTPEELQLAVDDVIKRHSDLIWVNKVLRTSGAFAVASFTGANNKTMHFAKAFPEIQGSMFGKWDNDQLPGLTYQSKASKKAFTGFKPQQLFKNGNQFQSGSALLSNLTANQALSENIRNGLGMLADGKLPVFVGERENLESIRDYLGETLQAAAVTTHPELVGGDLEEARIKILGGNDWTRCSIEFPMSQTSNLVDSVITAPSGEQVGLSSKGGKGSDASAKNLYEALEKMEPSVKAKLTKKYALAAKVINMIATNGQLDGPLVLGMDLGLITEDNATEIKNHIKNHEVNPRKLSPWARQYTKLYATKEPAGWNFGYWLLANLAKECSRVVNADPNFGKGCIQFLNNSSLIQIYTSVGVKGNDVSVTSLKAIYPPKFTGTIVLNGAKMYNARGIIGRFGFGFN